MTRSAALTALVASVVLSGCVTRSGERPFLTKRAFARAAAHCHVVSQGVRHTRNSELPYGNYRIPGPNGEAREDSGESRTCMKEALRGYRYEFLAEDIPQSPQ